MVQTIMLQTLKIFIKKCIEYNRLLVINFIDYEKTIDSVELEIILESKPNR